MHGGTIISTSHPAPTALQSYTVMKMLANTGPSEDPWRYGDAINLVIVVTVKNEVAFLQSRKTII